jgi:hypothetical protein
MPTPLSRRRALASPRSLAALRRVSPLRNLSSLGSLAALCALASCGTVRSAIRMPELATPSIRGLSFTNKQVDPTIEIRGPSGNELGVGTEYGVVFLGRTSQSGEIDVTAWYGDGPSIEAALVESLGGGVYLASTEIRVPAVALDFSALKAGSEVLIRGRRGAQVWTADGQVRSHPDVQGLLLSAGSDFPASDDQIGAGVYLRGPDGEDDAGLRLVGLVSGALELDENGATRRFLTCVGAQDLWRVPAWHRDLSHRRRWVYREDIL